MSNRSKKPRMVFAGTGGKIFDHSRLEMAGVDGGEPVPVTESDLIPLPRGSDLFTMPGRAPIGIDPRSGRSEVFDGNGDGYQGEVSAVAAFLAPAHTLALLPAYVTLPSAPALPLFAYSAVGFRDGQFWATGLRVDPDPRQDPWRFDLERLKKQVARRIATAGENRVLGQLERCALAYGCRAAQNFFIGRHEAPLPTSVTCNSQCIGCISLQTDGEFKASHERLDKAPTPAEVAAVALEHIARVPQAVVSFGQGCEGEPLLNGELLVDSVRLIRATTDAGTINLNTNASKPDVVESLALAGLDSIRVSINSPRPEVYDAYYRPHGYSLEDVLASIAAMKRHGRFASINYLVFPGVTDTEEEYAAVERLIEMTALDMIQMRNLNIDPEVYAAALPPGTLRPGFGIREVMDRLRTRFPDLLFGYFNPPKERFQALRVSQQAANDDRVCSDEQAG
jgi:wyosine [tRNA(Phe)-imidazoG37] synthetase (radical SAM superfamily)